MNIMFIEHFSHKRVLSEGLTLSSWYLGDFFFPWCCGWMSILLPCKYGFIAALYSSVTDVWSDKVVETKLEKLAEIWACKRHPHFSFSCSSCAVFFFVCFVLRQYIISTMDLHNGVTERFRSSESPSLSHQQNTVVWSRLRRRIRALLNDVVIEQNSIILLLGDVEMHRGGDLLSKVNIKAAEFPPLSTLSAFIWWLYWKTMSQIPSRVLFIYFLNKRKPPLLHCLHDQDWYMGKILNWIISSEQLGQISLNYPAGMKFRTGIFE